jgi:hypothetical protein
MQTAMSEKTVNFTSTAARTSRQKENATGRKVVGSRTDEVNNLSMYLNLPAPLGPAVQSTSLPEISNRERTKNVFRE